MTNYGNCVEPGPSTNSIESCQSIFLEVKPNPQSVSVKQFYGNLTKRSSVIVQDPPSGVGYFTLQSRSKTIKSLPRRLDNLCGPSQIWKVFTKQKEALEFARTKRSGLITFAFQQSDGNRSFLVAHPKIFWHYDKQKEPHQRCSFEVIPESSACKLYFDLEYNTKFNPNKRGSLIVNNFISLILHYIQKQLRFRVTRDDILMLDSSTEEKFSRHLIFQFKSHIFCDNKSVGEFVHFICEKLKLFLESVDETLTSQSRDLRSAPTNCKCCQSSLKRTSCIVEAGLSVNELEDLFVVDRKGKKSLICDLSVYSKNRHFRLYKNTKWSKSASLEISEDNLYNPSLSPKDLPGGEIIDEAFFLDSLVSYVQYSSQSCKDLTLVNFVNPFQQPSLNSENEKSTPSPPALLCDLTLNPKITEPFSNKSPYPEVDNFINSVVHPGRIWRCAYFNSTNTLVFDIVGNRYCQNIKRQHRSNNVKYIVQLDNCTYYQKCHDVDCAEFRSKPAPLPEELKFLLLDDFDIPDTDLIEVANLAEDLYFTLP